MNLFAVEIRNLTVMVDKYPLISQFNLAVEPGKGTIFVGYPADLYYFLQVLSGNTLPDDGEILYYNEPPRRAWERGLIEVWSPDSSNISSIPPSPILIIFQPTFTLPAPIWQTFLALVPPYHLPFIKDINKSSNIIEINNLTRRC